MFILHADKNKLESKVLEQIGKRRKITFVHINSEAEVLEFLESKIVSLLIIGEELEDSLGLNLIDLMNDTSHIKVPIIYIVDNDNDILLENYSTIGIRDCVLRSELDINRIDKHLSMLHDQKKLYRGLTDLSIAVVDDSPLAIKVVTNILSEEGMNNVKTFTDPGQVLKEISLFSLFIVDIVMPEITGDKLVGMIRSLSPDCIIIAMSSVDNVKTISHVLSSGADDYIVKPFNNFELKARIRTNYRSFTLLKKLKEKNLELDRLSKTDSLTGAFNHGYIVTSIKNEIRNSRKTGESLSMLMLDLDLFKKVNDKYGHAVGDNVLISLAKLFLRMNRTRDLFGRYGGEEFLLLMPQTDLNRSTKISNSLNRIFSEMKIKGIDRPVTFSGGLVEWNGKEDYKDLMKRADDRLYLAKENGRNIIIS